MSTLFQDVRYACRSLMRSPAFTITVLLTLCLGIGANTAIFSIINAVFLRPLPYKDSGRLVMVWKISPQQGWKKIAIYPPELFSELQEQNHLFDQTAAFVAGENIGFDIVDGKDPERAPGAVVSSNFFSMLGAQARLGRTFSPDEDVSGSDQVVVISEELWKRRFDGDANLIGKTLTLNGLPYTVIGIIPAEIDLPRGTQLWVPSPLQADKVMNTALRTTYSLTMIARLKPGVTVEQAQMNMDLLANRLRQEQPDVIRNAGLLVSPLHHELFGNVRSALFFLWGAVVIVLMIACANVANLQLERTASRRREIAIRSALGASRLRIIRQLCTESLLLAILGGGLGLLFSFWIVDSLIAFGPPDVARLKHLTIDSRVLGFTFIGSLLTGLLFGLAPALEASNPDLQGMLMEGATTSTTGLRHHRLLRIFVLSEIALALVLLIGAGLLTKTFFRLIQTDLGFDTNKITTMRLSPPGWKYADRDQQFALYQRIIDQVKTLPQVHYVGGINILPVSGRSFQVLFTTDNQSTSEEPLTSNCSAITPDYFNVMRILLVKGRFFTDQDARESPKVVMIDEAMAQRFWPDQEPTGKRLNFQGSWREIVGVVGNIKPIGLEAQSDTQMYVPQSQFDFPWPYMHLVIRTTVDDPAALFPALRRVVLSEEKEGPVNSITTVEQLISDSGSRQRFNMILLAIFATLSVALVAVGIYGVMAYSVTQRKHEIGVRMALGAQPSDVLKLIMIQGLILVAAGVIAGLAGAFLMTRILSSFLYGLSATDLMTFLEGSLLLAGIALLACYIPAWRATKVDPIIALRNW